MLAFYLVIGVDYTVLLGISLVCLNAIVLRYLQRFLP